MPRCRSATLNACSRLCRALDFVRLWKSTSSGLGTAVMHPWDIFQCQHCPSMSQCSPRCHLPVLVDEGVEGQPVLPA